MYVHRSMQELLVRFEPPDIFGVPPSTKQPEVVPATVCTSTSTHDSPPATGVCTSTFTHGQLKSLPTDLLDMGQDSASASPFQSLPPLNAFCKYWCCSCLHVMVLHPIYVYTYIRTIVYAHMYACHALCVSCRLSSIHHQFPLL